MNSLVSGLLGDNWSISPSMYENTLTYILQAAEPERFPELEASQPEAFFMSDEPSRPYKVVGENAFINISGVMFPKPNFMTWMGYGTASTTTQLAVKHADADPKIKNIYMTFSSGGGLVAGTKDLADVVKACKTNTVAYVESMAASAAYWVASSCSEIVVSETAIVGNIGVIQTVMDNKGMLEKYGIKKIEFVSSQSPNKRPDYDTKAGKEKIQTVVDDLAEVFIGSVKGNRPDAQIDSVAGDVLVGARAVEMGFADRVGSLNSILDSASLADYRNSSAVAEIEDTSGDSAQNNNLETEEQMADKNDELKEVLARLQTLEDANAQLKETATQAQLDAEQSQKALQKQLDEAAAAHLKEVTAKVDSLASLPEEFKADVVSASVENPKVLEAFAAIQAVIEADTLEEPKGHGATNDEPEDDFRAALQAKVNANIEGGK